jgi:hypothetical protein
VAAGCSGEAWGLLTSLDFWAHATNFLPAVVYMGSSVAAAEINYARLDDLSTGAGPVRLPELLRKQAGGLKHEWHVAAAEARVQKLCGRDEAAGLSQARLAHEVERFQRMRVAELVEETAKELQERGGAEQGDTVNMWCVSAMEKAAAGCSPLGIPRAGSAPEGYRFLDKEFEVLMAMWMGLIAGGCSAGVSDGSVQATDRHMGGARRHDVWWSVGGARRQKRNGAAPQRAGQAIMGSTQDRGHPSHAGAAGMGWVKETAG